MTDGICFIYVFTTVFMFFQEACLGGVLQRGCTGSFLREVVECVETETIPGFMGPAKEKQNEDDGLKLMQRHCRDEEGETRQIPQMFSSKQQENRISSVTKEVMELTGSTQQATRTEGPGTAMYKTLQCSSVSPTVLNSI